MIVLLGWRLGLIAMVPKLVSIACIGGVMGFAGIPIDMVNLMIASIAIGLAVDDTMHFLHHFRVHYQANGHVEAAITHSLGHSGRALVSTTIILTIGFFVFVFAPLSAMVRFGLLIGLTVVMARLVDLVFGPALVRTFHEKRPKQADSPEPPQGDEDEPVEVSGPA